VPPRGGLFTFDADAPVHLPACPPAAGRVAPASGVPTCPR
jgi:hypothetical protein